MLKKFYPKIVSNFWRPRISFKIFDTMALFNVFLPNLIQIQIINPKNPTFPNFFSRSPDKEQINSDFLRINSRSKFELELFETILPKQKKKNLGPKQRRRRPNPKRPMKPRWRKKSQPKRRRKRGGRWWER